MAEYVKTDKQKMDYTMIKDKVERFVKHLSATRKHLEEQLSEYQSFSTTEDEFARVFECLGAIDEVQGYFSKRTGTVAVMFPLNMPLYGLVLYGIFPALVADTVAIRAPQRMTSLIRNLIPVLDLSLFFPNITFVFESREMFVATFVASADVTIFTGKLENARQVMNRTKPNSLFLFNGWGCNPIVIGTGSDLKDAAKRTVNARLFSSGQDCAAPDAIFVRQDEATEFLKELCTELKNVKIGDYYDPDVRVGPITDKDHIQEVSELLVKHSTRIIHGGVVDYRTSTIHPTVIYSSLSEAMNFVELFAPVFFINSYQSDEELSTYFKHPKYIANEMYISLFGRNDYVESLGRSIIVRDQVVFDIDRGNDEFGGYSIGASFVAVNGDIDARPVLVPRDIFAYLASDISSQRLTMADQKRVTRQVRKSMIQTFGHTLIFGFVFGSIASMCASGNSDINMMVIVSDLIPFQHEQFKKSMEKLHTKEGLNFRPLGSMVVLRLQELETAISSLETEPSLICHRSLQSDNKNLWLSALSGRQRGVAGDKSLSISYIKRALVILQMLESIELKNHSETISEGPLSAELLTREPTEDLTGSTEVKTIELRHTNEEGILNRLLNSDQGQNSRFFPFAKIFPFNKLFSYSEVLV